MDGVAGKMMLEACKDVATSRISDDDDDDDDDGEILIKVENVDDKETHLSPQVKDVKLTLKQ